MYYYNNGKIDVGPFSISNLRKLRDSQLISDGTLVSHEKSSDWMPFFQLIDEDKSPLFSLEKQPELGLRAKSNTATENAAQVMPSLTSEMNAEDVCEPTSSGLTTSTKQKTVTAVTKLKQSDDPAYKYISKTRSAKGGGASSAREAHKGLDPAYKYIPRTRLNAEEFISKGGSKNTSSRRRFIKFCLAVVIGATIQHAVIKGDQYDLGQIIPEGIGAGIALLLAGSLGMIYSENKFRSFVAATLFFELAYLSSLLFCQNGVCEFYF